jgi:hypothetical protein
MGGPIDWIRQHFNQCSRAIDLAVEETKRTAFHFHFIFAQRLPEVSTEQLLCCFSRPLSSLNFRLQVIGILRVRAHEIAFT